MKKEQPTLLQQAAQETLAKQMGVLSKQMGSAMTALRAEYRQATGEAKRNAAMEIAELKKFNKLRGLQKGSTLTPEQSTLFIKGVEQHRVAIERLARKNARLTNADGTQQKGQDGMTLTERMRAEQTEVTTKEDVINLLKTIADKKEALNRKTKDNYGKVKDTLRQGLSAFLGPAGPLIETLSSLKDEYGDDAKELAGSIYKWFNKDKDLIKEFEKESDRDAIRNKKLFGMLSDKFRKFSGLIGGGVGDLLSMFGFGGGGSGKGGIFTKAKRLARKVPGIGKLMRGGIGSKLAGFAGKGLGFAGKLLPGIGVALGAHGLSQLEEAKETDTLGDRVGAYGSAAVNGAGIGAGIGSFIPVVGTIVGAALGALGGVAYATLKRNWKSAESLGSRSWNFIKGKFYSMVHGIKDFGLAILDLPGTLASVLTRGMERVYRWLKENVPGFAALTRLGADVAKGSEDKINTITGKASQIGKAVAQEAIKTKDKSMSGLRTAASVLGIGSSDTGNKATTATDKDNKFSAFNGKLDMPSGEVSEAILSAADKLGIDKGYMTALGNKESSFNPKAKSNYSSATGLYQFTDSTWADMVKKYGGQHNIGLGDRLDPKKNALMGALFSRDNANTLKSQGHTVDGASMYSAHMLGSGGANKLLNALKSNPNASAADLLPSAAKSNYDIFYNKDGSKKTVKEVHSFYQDKIENKAAAYNSVLSKESTSVSSTISPSANRGDIRASIAPATGSFERANSVAPEANITMGPVQSSSYDSMDKGSVENRQLVAATDVPFVLGDNHMVVINAGMMGA